MLIIWSKATNNKVAKCSGYNLANLFTKKILPEVFLFSPKYTNAKTNPEIAQNKGTPKCP